MKVMRPPPLSDKLRSLRSGPGLASWIMAILLLGPLNLWASEREDYEQAWQFFQQGRYTEAIGGFKSYLAKHPQGRYAVEARFTLARIEPSGHNAFVHYQFIVDNYPQHPLAAQASYAIAQYHQNMGTFREAKACYFSTYSKYGQTPAGSESLYRLTLLSLQADSLEAAEAYARAFSDQYSGNPRYPAIVAAMSEAYQAKGDTAKARAGWRLLLASYPTAYEAGLARERLLAAEEDSEEPGTSEPEIPELVPPRPAQAGKYFLQIGAYRDASVLKRWISRLSSRGYAAVVDSSDYALSGLYRLRLGPYRTRYEAEEASRKLKTAEGLETMVVEVR